MIFWTGGRYQQGAKRATCDGRSCGAAEEKSHEATERHSRGDAIRVPLSSSGLKRGWGLSALEHGHVVPVEVVHVKGSTALHQRAVIAALAYGERHRGLESSIERVLDTVARNAHGITWLQCGQVGGNRLPGDGAHSAYASSTSRPSAKSTSAGEVRSRRSPSARRPLSRSTCL